MDKSAVAARIRAKREQLGLDPSLAMKAAPFLSKYVGGKGSADAAKLLARTSQRLDCRRLWLEDDATMSCVTGHQHMDDAPGFRRKLTDLHFRGAPALVVEIISPSTRRRDRQLKPELYARAGVREYWMVDPKAATITVSRRIAPGDLPVVGTLRATADDVLTSPLLPAFLLPLKHLFRD